MEDDILQRDSNAHSFFVLRILKRDTRWQPCVGSGEFVLGNWIYGYILYLFHPFLAMSCWIQRMISWSIWFRNSWFCFQRVEPCQVDMGVVWWHFLRLRHFHSISETPFDSIFGVNRWCRGLIPQPVRYRISLITEWVAQSCPHVPPTGAQPVPICMVVFWWYNKNI